MTAADRLRTRTWDHGRRLSCGCWLPAGVPAYSWSRGAWVCGDHYTGRVRDVPPRHPATVGEILAREAARE